MQARVHRTALETYRERTGVCRDCTHLAITSCRALNIPARYCTGYLGRLVGVPQSPELAPPDVSVGAVGKLSQVCALKGGCAWHLCKCQRRGQ